MLVLVIGLLVFLGIHSIGLFATGWRAEKIDRLGVGAWKGIYALVALVGLALIVWGYGQARLSPIWLWIPPEWTRHLAALLTILAFILLVATYLPGSKIKARVGHPMLLGVKFWAIAHLLANGTVADVLLFGSFLAWAIALFVVLRRRDRRAGVIRAPGRASRDALVVVVGLIAWVVFAMWLHGLLIGVRPFGG
ncbi:MAG TPA: hypothetical protein ENI17_12140 [Pseudomonas xinjiangensis]|uniref:NnrU domain-containing protein n=2 Tax=root TaxID=1 RepID=A0A7V1BP42_9GAMM|nr:hypothetical protein [Halopseudomonas xinjiangensis]HEC48361.1 hypothetical protein [Halopseudomonas xinjiangensis]